MMKKRKNSLYSWIKNGFLGLLILGGLGFALAGCGSSGVSGSETDSTPMFAASAEATVSALEEPESTALSPSHELPKLEAPAVSSEPEPAPEPDGRKKIALTFDDGPNGKTTERILKVLQENDAKATFFMVGNRINTYPDTVKKVYESGSEIASHTYSHFDLTKLNGSTLQYELTETNRLNPRIGPDRTETVTSSVWIGQRSGEKCFPLPVDPMGCGILSTGKPRNAEKTVENVLRSAHDGAIVLMHDLHASNGGCLRNLDPQTEGNGIRHGYGERIIGLSRHYAPSRKGVQLRWETASGKKWSGGKWYLPSDAELKKQNLAAKELLFDFHQYRPSQVEEKRQLLQRLFGSLGENAWIEPPFSCDYGWNIHAGKSFYANSGCVILDCGKVTIGDHVLLGPQVGIYTVGHPLDPQLRRPRPGSRQAHHNRE